MNTVNGSIELLKIKLYESVRKLKPKTLGVAFSGGVDSTLLAQITKDIDKNTTLITVSFSDNKDVDFSTIISKKIELPILTKTIGLEELEKDLKIVLSSINFKRIARLENCLCFYHVFKLAAKKDLKIVASANGMDELFCGYDVYKRQYTTNKELLMNLMNHLVETALNDKKEIDKLAKLFNINYVCPFLFDDFSSFSKMIPFSYKIKNKEDVLRKHVLRSIALKIGVPKIAALRPKKAFQYSSGVHKAIRKLAKKNGFTKFKSQKMGYRSVIKAYINYLRKNS